MKNKLKRSIGILLVAALVPVLTACSPKDVLLYLYGGDDFIEKEQPPAYTRYDAANGLTLVYDANIWAAPGMAQDDTLSIGKGGQMDSTVVLMQVTDAYTDFLAQSGAELEGETATVEYALDFTVPDASVQAVRYDCGSYQTIFAQVDYDSGTTMYLTAATKVSDYEPIIALLQSVYPTGQTPETAAQ